VPAKLAFGRVDINTISTAQITLTNAGTSTLTITSNAAPVASLSESAFPQRNGLGSCIRLRPERANHVWSYDFVSGKTYDGRTLRVLDLREPAVGTGLKMEPLDVGAGQAVLNKKRKTP